MRAALWSNDSQLFEMVNCSSDPVLTDADVLPEADEREFPTSIPSRAKPFASLMWCAFGRDCCFAGTTQAL